MVDVRLISTAAASPLLEPGHDICIQPERDLLLYRTVEHVSFRFRPVEDFRDVGRIDLLIWRFL